MRKYMDFVPKGGKRSLAKPAGRPAASAVVAKPAVARPAEQSAAKPMARQVAKPAARPAVAKSMVKPAMKSATTRPVAKTAAKPMTKSVEKPATSKNGALKVEDYRKKFVNLEKINKRPLSKNVYQKKAVLVPTEAPSGPVTIIDKPEKDSKVGLVVTIIITIILGAAAGTVAFLLLPK